MFDKEASGLEVEVLDRDLDTAKFEGKEFADPISGVIWRSYSTTTEADLRLTDGTPAIRLGYRRATFFGFKNNGVKKVQASYAANYKILLPGYYWHLKPTIRLERSDDSYLVILGNREVTGKINNAPALLGYGSSLIGMSGDEGALYDLIDDYAHFRATWSFWINSTRIPQGDV